MSEQASISQFAQLQDVAERLLELDVSDTDLGSKVLDLKLRVTQELDTPVGNPNIAEARAKAIKSRQNRAQDFVTAIAPLVEEAKNAGRTGYSDIARYLNEKGIRTSRGSMWLPASVMRVMQEIEKLMPR